MFFVAKSEVRKKVESIAGLSVGQRVRLRTQSIEDLNAGTVAALDGTGQAWVRFDIRTPDYIGPVTHVIGVLDEAQGYRVGERVCVPGAEPAVQAWDAGVIRMIDTDGTVTVEMEGLRRGPYRGSLSNLRRCP